MKITVITVCRNAESYIGQTIASVVSQDYDDLEYVIVDGASTDATLDVVKRYSRGDRRIKWISEPDSGISDAMNKGIELATGDVIAHLHADDYYPDDTILSSVVAIFMHNPGALWGTGGVSFTDTCGVETARYPARKYSFNKLVRGNCIFHPATFVRREAFIKVGMFDISLKYSMDYDMWLRLGTLQNPVLVDRVLACYRVHNKSTSFLHTDEAFAEELSVRKRYLGEKSLRYKFHYLNYLLKNMFNRYLLHRHLHCS